MTVSCRGKHVPGYVSDQLLVMQPAASAVLDDSSVPLREGMDEGGRVAPGTAANPQPEPVEPQEQFRCSWLDPTVPGADDDGHQRSRGKERSIDEGVATRPAHQIEESDATLKSTSSQQFTLRCHRGNEALQLQMALERCCRVSSEHTTPPGHHHASPSGELILVTGPSGCGKTCLVESVVRSTLLQSKSRRDVSCPPNGCDEGGPNDRDCDEFRGVLVSGKFDQLERRDQYYAVVQALTELALFVTRESSPAALRRVRSSLTHHEETVGVVADLVPEIRALLRDSDEAGDKERPPQDAKPSAIQRTLGARTTAATTTTPEGGSVARQRLQLGLRMLLSALCSPVSPIVLFLDDLQWAEPASLDVLASLFTDRIPGLVVVGACRDNEVDPSSYLCVILRELEARNVAISQVIVSNAGLTTLRTALSDSFGEGMNGKASSLARILHKHTDGNMFFVTQLVRFLVNEGFVYKPSDQLPWTFDSEGTIVDGIRPVPDVVSLLTLVIRKEEREVQDTLMIASCLGAEFSEVVLRAAVAFDVTEAIQVAERMRFLKRSLHDKQTWRFAHDRIQESAYSLIPIHEREQIHLRIGRNLWGELSEAEMDIFAHVVVKQLRLGVELVTDPGERELLATLLLRAGELAAKASAHVTAHEYMTLGIGLLSRRHWRDQYLLSLALYNAIAEVEYCLGNFERMDALVAEIMENARVIEDKVRSQTARIYSLGSRNRLDEAVDVGLWTLRTFLGEQLPSKPTTMSIMTDLWRTKRLLRCHSDDDLTSMPTTDNFHTLASIRIMCLILTYAVMSRPALAPVVAMRIVQHSIRRGLCGMSSIGFGYYGMILAMFFNEVDAGIRYGNVALRIVDRFDAAGQLARVSTVVHCFCVSHKKPFSELLTPLRVAHRVGLGSGDIEHSLMAAGVYATVALDTSRHLSDVSIDVANFLALTRAYNHSSTDLMLRPLAQFIQCVQGQVANPSVLTGTYLEWESALRTAQASSHATAASVIMTYKLVLESLFRSTSGDAEATAAALTLSGSGFETAPCFVKATVWLHQGLACLAQSHMDCFLSGRRLRRAKQCHRKLVRLSRYSESNYGRKALLLGAEIMVRTGAYHQGLLQYDKAIASSKSSEAWCDAGLACERLSWALQSQGRSDESFIYLNQASRYYEQWGAAAKVVELKEALKARGAAVAAAAAG